MQRLRSSEGYIEIVLAIIAALIIIVVAFILLNRNHTAAKPTPPTTTTTDISSYCISQTLTAGDTGHCVRDIQTLVNYMEHSGLTECRFTNGATLGITAVFDSSTTTQIKAVQDWAQCYAKQEGFTSNVKETGSVDKATWGELCTYGYTNPQHNGASGAVDSIAAGKDAGCAQL